MKYNPEIYLNNEQINDILNFKNYTSVMKEYMNETKDCIKDSSLPICSKEIPISSEQVEIIRKYKVNSGDFNYKTRDSSKSANYLQ